MNTMRVRELIAHLQKLDPEAPIMTEHPDSGWGYPIVGTHREGPGTDSRAYHVALDEKSKDRSWGAIIPSYDSAYPVVTYVIRTE